MNKIELLKALKETQGEYVYKKQAVDMVQSFKHQERIVYFEIRSLWKQEIHLKNPQRNDDRSLFITFALDLPPKYSYSYLQAGGCVEKLGGLCSSHNFRRCLSLLGITV